MMKRFSDVSVSAEWPLVVNEQVIFQQLIFEFMDMKYIFIILVLICSWQCCGVLLSVTVLWRSITVSCLEPDLEMAAVFPFSLSPSPLRLALGVSDLCPSWLGVSVADARFNSSILYTIFCKQRLDRFTLSITICRVSCPKLTKCLWQAYSACF